MELEERLRGLQEYGSCVVFQSGFGAANAGRFSAILVKRTTSLSPTELNMTSISMVRGFSRGQDQSLSAQRTRCMRKELV